MAKSGGRAWLGPVLIAIAALLWATDALFRFPAVEALDPVMLVFCEHAIAVLFLILPVLLRNRKELFALSPSSWIYAAIAGIGGSALGTVFFTASFKYLNPSVAILLQKTQPLLVVALAITFLRERPHRAFFGWALVALMAAIILSFPDLQFNFLRNGLDFRSRGTLYALSAAALWALATVTGRVFTQTVHPTVATFWRYLFGLGALGGFLILTREPIPLAVILDPALFKAVAYMALFSGLLAMIAYYQGLKRTPASVATFVELVFPVSAIALNAVFLKSPLETTQLLAGAILIFAVSRVSSAMRG